MEQLTLREITIILEALQEKYGFGYGYSSNKEVSLLQAKLSMMAEMAHGTENCEKKENENDH